MATRAKKRKLETKHLAEPTPKEPSLTTILQLPNECLQKVLSYLNVRELIKIEAVCKHFKANAEEIYKTKRSLDFESLIDNELSTDDSADEDEESESKNHSISMKEGEKIFRRVGAYVETLKMKRGHFFGNGNPLDFVWKFCQKLQEVSFKDMTLNDEMCTKLAGVFSNVKDVRISRISFGSPITDSLLQTTFNLQKLKKINLAFAKVEGDFLTHLHDILVVSLIYCWSLKLDKFVNFIEVNPQLTSLDIMGSSQIDGACLKAIGEKLVNLQKLGMSTDYEDATLDNYLLMMDLPKLTVLMINFTHCGNKGCEVYLNMEALMGALLARVASHNRLKNLSILFNRYIVTNQMAQAINKLTKLQILGFNGTPSCIWCTLGDIKCAKTLEVLVVSDTKVSSNGLANVIKKCKKLELIYASGCSKLQADFVPAIKKTLRTRRHQLVINLRKSTVCEEEVGSYDHDKLKLNF